MGVTSVDSSTEAAADRRFPRARPAGGKLTARPPLVRRAGGGAADATSHDAWTEAERWGGGTEGWLLLATRARTTSRSRGVGFVHGFEQCYGVFLAWPKTQKNDGGKLIYVGISSKTQSASLALAFSVSLALV